MRLTATASAKLLLGAGLALVACLVPAACGRPDSRSGEAPAAADAAEAKTEVKEQAEVPAAAPGSQCPDLARIVAARSDKPAFSSLPDDFRPAGALRCEAVKSTAWMFMERSFRSHPAYQCVFFETAETADKEAGSKAYYAQAMAQAECFPQAQGWTGAGGGGRTDGDGRIYFTDLSKGEMVPMVEPEGGGRLAPVRLLWTFEQAATPAAPAGHQVSLIVYAP